MIWTCPICKRNKFDRKYQSHNCIGGFRKRKFGPKTMTKAELIAKLANFNDNDLVMVYDSVNCAMHHIENNVAESSEIPAAVLYMGLDWDLLKDEEDLDGNRVNLGLIPCKYCGDKNCNFDCDESQADGYE